MPRVRTRRPFAKWETSRARISRLPSRLLFENATSFTKERLFPFVVNRVSWNCFCSRVRHCLSHPVQLRSEFPRNIRHPEARSNIRTRKIETRLLSNDLKGGGGRESQPRPGELPRAAYPADFLRKMAIGRAANCSGNFAHYIAVRNRKSVPSTSRSS